MGLLGGGLMTPLGGAKTVQLNDTAGTDAFIVKDADGFPMFKVDSDGNVKIKGKVMRI